MVTRTIEQRHSLRRRGKLPDGEPIAACVSRMQTSSGAQHVEIDVATSGRFQFTRMVRVGAAGKSAGRDAEGCAALGRLSDHSASE